MLMIIRGILATFGGLKCKYLSFRGQNAILGKVQGYIFLITKKVFKWMIKLEKDDKCHQPSQPPHRDLNENILFFGVKMQF